MKEYLTDLGATEVITEEENSKRDIKSLYQVLSSHVIDSTSVTVTSSALVILFYRMRGTFGRH